jgi:hypothetical protein
VVAGGGWRTLRRGETKPTRREAMRELRSGRLAVSGDSMLPEGALARIVSSVRYPDGSSCVDPGETTALAALTLAHSRSAAHFVLGPADFERGTVVRTDCQGPSEEDVLGSKTPLATASLPVTALGSKSLHVDLTAGGAFRTGAYTGSRSGAISLQLVLKAMRVGVTRLKISGGLFEE